MNGIDENMSKQDEADTLRKAAGVVENLTWQPDGTLCARLLELARLCENEADTTNHEETNQ